MVELDEELEEIRERKKKEMIERMSGGGNTGGASSPDKPIDLTDATMEEAVKRVASRLGPAIVRMAEAPQTGINRVEVRLESLRNLKELKVFEDFLKNDVEGVESVRESRIAGRTVSLQVDFAGSGDELFQVLSTHMDFPFPAEMGQTEEGAIVIDLR